MKTSDLSGIHFQFDSMLSEETIRAQRLAELKDIAEWRAKRLQAIKDWSEPKAVAERAEKYQAGPIIKPPPRLEKLEFEPLPGITLTPVIKSTKRRAWYVRLLRWLRR